MRNGIETGCVVVLSRYGPCSIILPGSLENNPLQKGSDFWEKRGLVCCLLFQEQFGFSFHEKLPKNPQTNGGVKH